jgi:hypothetical protein
MDPNKGFAREFKRQEFFVRSKKEESSVMFFQKDAQ